MENFLFTSLMHRKPDGKQVFTVGLRRGFQNNLESPIPEIPETSHYFRFQANRGHFQNFLS
jgi:hypothetical protein